MATVNTTHGNKSDILLFYVPCIMCISFLIRPFFFLRISVLFLGHNIIGLHQEMIELS